MENFKICIGNDDNSIYIKQEPDWNISTEYNIGRFLDGTPTMFMYMYIVCSSLQLKLPCFLFVQDRLRLVSQIDRITQIKIENDQMMPGTKFTIPLYLIPKMKKVEDEFYNKLEEMRSRGITKIGDVYEELING